MVAETRKTIGCDGCAKTFTVHSDYALATFPLDRQCIRAAEARGWKWRVSACGRIVYACEHCPVLRTDQGETHDRSRQTRGAT